MKFGEKIKSIRTNMGLTQEKFSRKIGVSQQTLSDWERGRSLPSFATLSLLSVKLEVNINFFKEEITDIEKNAKN
jgi:transcriptional regulator with XRE-family HTH domain